MALMPLKFKYKSNTQKNRKYTKFIQLFILLIIFQISSQLETEQNTSIKKISKVNLLLPICPKSNCNEVYAKLIAYNGCYEWKSEDPSLVQIQPIQKQEDSPGCYSEVYVYPKSKSTKEITFVTAKDKKTNEYFKCKVGFGEVTKISIEKNFDVINVDDIFELHVLAHDERGNIFSSLEGWKFNWRILNGHNNAQLIKFIDHGKIETGEKREKIEKEGNHADIILIKGSQTGKILVSVDILEDELKNKVITDQRELYIIEPFKIIPDNELFIIPNTQYNFDLIYTHSKKIIPKSEHRYFKWSVTDEKCGYIKNFGNFYSKDIGCTVKVIAQDTRLEKFNIDEVIVHVLFPNSIEIGYMEIEQNDKKILEKVQIENKLLNFNLAPTFKLVEGKHYVFKNFLMYDDQPVYYNYNKINFNFDLSNLNNYVYRNKINYKNNNELATLTAHKVTEEQIIQSSITIEKNKELVIKKNVIIYEKVRIKKFNMPYFTLPYLGFGNGKNNRQVVYGQELYLIITGGTGQYIYTSSNLEIVDIIQDSYLLSRNRGKANIVVADKEINSNSDNIDIYVKDLSSFTFMEERQEIEIGNNFEVTPIALQQNQKYDIKNIFTNCSNIKLNYKSNDNNLAQIQENFFSKNNNQISRYQYIRNFINNNIQSLADKLNLINIKNNTDEFDYMDYSNFGICGSDSFEAKQEGLLKIFYESTLNLKDKFSDNINYNTINSINPANIYIYSQMEINNIITDNFTKFILEKNKIENPDLEKNFLIAEGSGIELKLKGGIVPWTGYQNDYIEEKLVIEQKTDKTYSADKVSKYIKFINKKEKIIFVQCNKKGYEFDFMINIHNKKDISLIKPGQSKVKFRISCRNPDHLSMFLLSQTNNFLKTDDFILNEIFNDPQKKGIEYFIKKNSSDIIRIYAFDQDKKIFSNITSLRGYFEKNKKDKNFFDILEKDKIINNPNSYIKDKEIIENIFAIDNQEFIQDYILFNQKTENSKQNKFELKYNLKNNINNQYIYLQMIDVPEIYPQNASVYVRENNKYPLTIEKGSGDFSIQLSDDNLAKYNYDKNNRKLYITPLKPGILIVKVIDNQLGTGFNYEAKSTLYLSDVSRILVYGGGLLMNNKSTTVGIEVYDSFENKFSEDQQKLIPLRLNESFYGLDVSFNHENTKLNVTGLSQGLYPLIVKDDSSDVISNIATIEVFDKLEVYPPYLLLVPGTSFTLSVTGGPKNKENVIIKYEIADDKIANVSENYPNVFGKLYGKTNLKISLMYKYDYNKIYNINDDKHIINKTDLLCVENVPIRVDFPDNVEIIGAENNRKIYSKSTIRLLAALKKGNEVFTYGIGPFRFNWNVDNDIVGKIKYYLKKSLYKKENQNENIQKNYDENCEECESLSLVATKVDPNPESSIGVFLTAYEEGIITVSLEVTVLYPSPYTMHKPYKFSTSSKISVNDQLYVDLPGFYGENLKKTGLYLIPYNVDHELHTNKNSEQLYSIVRQHDLNDVNNKNAKIITMTDSGRITSYFRNGLAYISISQINNKDNNVPVILPILINDFYSIFIEKTHTIIDMEVGQDILLKIIIQHYHGLLFADKFERLPLRAVVSHPNIANVELIEFNSKLRLRAQNIGYTNIILFHPETRKIYDVFRLNVVQQTTLLNKILISVGGTIDFFGKDPIKKKELMINGEWISDNSKVMKIDKNGFGTAISEGEATIILKEKNSQKIITSTKVIVRKISRVSFDKTKLPKSFSDIKKNGMEFINKYEIPIILYSNDDEVFTNNENDKLSKINQKIKIRCITDAPNYVKGDEINKDNINECIFTIRENKYEASKKKGGWGKQADKPKDINIELIVEDYNRNKNSVQEKVPFASSFKIKNDLHIINLSYKEREYFIHIDNLNDLDIKISNEKLVKIEEINRDKKYIKIKIPFSVDDDFKGVILYLANVLTGQKEEIIINYNNSGTGIGVGSSVNTLTDFFFVIVLTCLLLFIGYFLIFSGRKNPTLTRGNMNFNTLNYVPGRGYPTNEANNYNNMGNNNYNTGYFGNMNKNNYQNFAYTNNNEENRNNYNNNMNNDFNFSGNRRGFNNLMRSNNYFMQQPRGSSFNYNNSNINMNMPY